MQVLERVEGIHSSEGLHGVLRCKCMQYDGYEASDGQCAGGECGQVVSDG